MARKGEERGRWAEPPRGGPPPGPRPVEGTGWLDPGLQARPPDRRDPFARRRPLGPKNYHRPDDRIQDEVCERLARSGIDARDVEVAVEAGEVTLAGTVGSREEKRALEDLADDVFGVEDVHNRLHLAHRVSPARPSGALRAEPRSAARRAGRGRRRGRAGR